MIKSILPQLFEKAISIDLNARHGSVLAIGEILHALSMITIQKGMKLKEFVGDDLIDKAKNLIPLFKERLYFRGIGGELMKLACSSFIENCSYAHMPFHNLDVLGNEYLKELNVFLKVKF